MRQMGEWERGQRQNEAERPKEEKGGTCPSRRGVRVSDSLPAACCSARRSSPFPLKVFFCAFVSRISVFLKKDEHGKRVFFFFLSSSGEKKKEKKRTRRRRKR